MENQQFANFNIVNSFIIGSIVFESYGYVNNWIAQKEQEWNKE